MLEKIRSFFVLKKFFLNLKNKRILKVIKYNKTLLNKLNIDINNFKAYKLIKKFNEKFGININDFDEKELDLNNKKILNEDLEYLNHFYDLKELNLYCNKLKNKNFQDLIFLNLSYNKITNINILEKVKLPKLEKLILNNNLITDINIFEKVNFTKLKELVLGSNEILDIKVLSKINFPEL